MDIEVHIFTRCDHHPIPENKGEVRVFLVVHNELNKRLPYFLEYYRKLGIDRFFIVDNGSLDGTVEYLCTQPDCHVFSTTDNYSRHIHWLNKLHNTYGIGHWCLCVDVDELFVYPESEHINIKQFCTFLEQEGADSVSGFLLDLYSDQNLNKVLYEPGRPFTETCCYFDNDYKFLKHIFPIRSLLKRPWSRHKKPFGGPRLRVFYSRWDKRTPFILWVVRFTNILGGILTRFGLTNWRVYIQGPPVLYKRSLIKWRKGLVWHPHGRMAGSMRPSDVTAALLHFKFFSDFYEQAMAASIRGQHYAGAVEYRRYLQVCKGNHDINFMYEGSTRYTETTDLVYHGLIQTSEAYQNYIAKLKTK